MRRIFVDIDWNMFMIHFHKWEYGKPNWSQHILKEVTIGDNSVKGAGSVVSTDIPANEVWAGNLARFVKKIYQNNLCNNSCNTSKIYIH